MEPSPEVSALAGMIGIILVQAAFAALFVHLFVRAAGSRITTLRQAVVAYSVYYIAASFISAVGYADGGPPNFKATFLILASSAIACAVEWLRLRKGRSVGFERKLPLDAE